MNMQSVRELTQSPLSNFRFSVPQSEETRAELSQIAWVPRQVRSLTGSLWSLSLICGLDHFPTSK
jgi:hypothetical protein